MYISKSFFLKPEEEKKRYTLHENSLEDVEYVTFLRRLLLPLETFLRRGDTVLDYGSGPEPVFAELVRQKGFDVQTYDPFFSLLFSDEETYDAVTSIEAFEHFHNPAKELKTIFLLVEPRGHIGVMTERHDRTTNFKTWYYTKDPTHVGYFSDTTFKWIESKYNLRRVYDDKERVLIWQLR
ncbi:MAG: class I SAM-dependent methyltransferase [Candidatus Paceibacterota bacterium]